MWKRGDELSCLIYEWFPGWALLAPNTAFNWMKLTSDHIMMHHWTTVAPVRIEKKKLHWQCRAWQTGATNTFLICFYHTVVRWHYYKIGFCSMVDGASNYRQISAHKICPFGRIVDLTFSPCFGQHSLFFHICFSHLFQWCISHFHFFCSTKLLCSFIVWPPIVPLSPLTHSYSHFLYKQNDE